jgi:hypothetical protein
VNAVCATIQIVLCFPYNHSKLTVCELRILTSSFASFPAAQPTSSESHFAGGEVTEEWNFLKTNCDTTMSITSTCFHGV